MPLERAAIARISRRVLAGVLGLGLAAWAHGTSAAATPVPEATAPRTPPATLAFPGAEGFGAHARGGAGGRQLAVTTREDTGREGSLRWALAQQGRRIVVFKVGGIFDLRSNLKVKEPYLTLDGSSAPGGGVTLKDGALEVLDTHDIIVRYLRVRPGDEAELGKGDWKGQSRGIHSSDAVSVKNSTDVIIDHVSASWSTDETISVTGSRRVTVQNCIIAEPLGNPVLHVENGVPIAHAYGALVEGDGVSYLKNYLAYFKIRGPQLAPAADGRPVRSAAVNNLVAFYENSGTRIKASHTAADFIVENNVYRHPLKSSAPDIHLIMEKIKAEHHRRPDAASTVGHTHVFIHGNLGPHRPQQQMDDWAGVRTDFDWAIAQRDRVATPPFTIEPLDLLPTDRVEEYVLEHAGDTLPTRDPVDERLIRQFRSGTGAVIKSQDDVGGYAR
jgi:hypothetical protein